ncbi:uncharacterized protein LOC126720959 isoform X2 [Quercus robur]|uniref:uncharacterized protein LOC126720959 isoform X2 n=1 Tax=Quercus robur TaxID=38942 RepID=UPI002162C932|nr:uncharacterized protein LOC126720959 isoform X2 [Quercus robur]
MLMKTKALLRLLQLPWLNITKYTFYSTWIPFCSKRPNGSNDFLKSMLKVENAETCKEVLTLLENLANGWRQPLKMKKLFYHHGTSSQLLEQYKVNGLLNLVWTVDILEENSYYIQILKVWDILPLSKMPRLANHLDVLFENYTVDKMNRCKHKSLTSL